MHALEDEYWYVREKAAIALGEIEDARAVEPLIQSLNDEDENADE
ncbi:MAG: HEAT repeat domain-containing protein [Patescibacteria group bacterium]